MKTNKQAVELWKWIREVELDHTMRDRYIPDHCCTSLLNKLDDILILLQDKNVPRYKFMLENDFINGIMWKLYGENESQRFMIFDFIKNLIHEVLLGGIKIKIPDKIP